MAKGETSNSIRFCQHCGRRVQPADLFCRGCGNRVHGEAPRKATSSTLIPGVIILVFFLSAGFALWMQVLSSAPLQAPSPPTQAAAPELPEGHPPIGLPPQAKQALVDLESDAERSPGDVSKWRQLAGMQYEASRFDPEYGAKAEASFKKLLALAPGDPGALAGLGNIHYDRREYDKAATYYEQYLQVEKNNPSVETDLATSYLYQGETEKAITSYRNVVAKHPEFAQAHFNLGIAYRSAGRREEAVASLKRARDLSSDQKIKERISSLVDQILADGKTLPSPKESAGETGAS